MENCPVLPATGGSPLLLVVVAVVAVVVGAVMVRCGRRLLGPVGVVVAIAACGLGWAASADAASDCLPPTAPPVTAPPATAPAPTTTAVAVLPTATPSTTTSTMSTSTTTPTSTTTSTTIPTITIPVSPAVSVTFLPSSTPNFCDAHGWMTGFVPDSDYTMVFAMSTSGTGSPDTGPSVQVQTNSQGAASAVGLVLSEALATYVAVTVDGVTSPWAALSC